MDPDDAKMMARQHYISLMVAAKDIKTVLRDGAGRHADMLESTRKGLEAYLAALEQEMRDSDVAKEDVFINTFTCTRCGQESDGGVCIKFSAGYGSRYDTLGEHKRGPICDACLQDLVPGRTNQLWLSNRDGMSMQECQEHLTGRDWDACFFQENYQKAVDLLREMVQDSKYADKAKEVLKELKELEQRPAEEGS